MQNETLIFIINYYRIAGAVGPVTSKLIQFILQRNRGVAPISSTVKTGRRPGFNILIDVNFYERKHVSNVFSCKMVDTCV